MPKQIKNPKPTPDEIFASFSKEEIQVIRWRLVWEQQARLKQLSPDSVLHGKQRNQTWTSWGLLTARGFGKSLVLSNWAGLEAAQTPNLMGAVVAPTHDDCRYVNFAGPTGLLKVIPESLILETSKQPSSVRLWNHSILRGFAGDTPDRLRGPQHHIAILDEVASFLYPEEALSNLRLGLRLGLRPKMVWATTPRPRSFLKQLIKETTVLTTGTIYENRENLPESFLTDLLKYEGTKIGRQELHGEIIDIEEMGVVKRSDWQLWPHNKQLPEFSLIVMSLDTAMTEKTVDSKTHDPDFSACSVWGVFDYNKKRNVMLLDCWQDRLVLNDLIARVKKERRNTYGDQHLPLIKSTYLSKPIDIGGFGHPIDIILIEQQGAGRPLRQMLAAEDILTHEYNPGRADKLQRLHMISHMFPNKRVWVVESETKPGTPKSWTDDLVSQVCSYAGKGSLPHDDLLDSCTQALRYILENFSGPVTVPAVQKPPVEVELVSPKVNPYD